MEKQKADNLITEYLPKIYGFAVKKSFSYEEAEELCAEIVKEVYTSLRSLREDELYNPEGYIWRISEHTYSRYVASRKKHQGVSIDGMDFPVYDEYNLGEKEEELLKLRQEIGFLTGCRRRIVYSFYYENKSVSSISREMRMPEGTVKWHLNKARIELKEGFLMERKIGKLGIAPVEAVSIGHNGSPGTNGGAEYYLKDKLNLNIVYSVYFTPRTREEIAEELGMTLVYIEDRITLLEENGFLIRTKGNAYTTHVLFQPTTYSLEWMDRVFVKKMEIAELLAKEYVPEVREALAAFEEIYIPSGNRELFEAAAVFYGISNKCSLPLQMDCSRWKIKTLDGGDYMVRISLVSSPVDPDYRCKVDPMKYCMCGNMFRESDKYPGLLSWSVDSSCDSRIGEWRNNQLSDYEYLYEILCGTICENAANAEKYERLRSRKFLNDNGEIAVMMVKGSYEDFHRQIPEIGEALKKKLYQEVLELYTLDAVNYPPQVRDQFIGTGEDFIHEMVPVMVMELLYGNGTFRPLTEQERVTANLLVFSDRIPVGTEPADVEVY